MKTWWYFEFVLKLLKFLRNLFTSFGLEQSSCKQIKLTWKLQKICLKEKQRKNDFFKRLFLLLATFQHLWKRLTVNEGKWKLLSMLLKITELAQLLGSEHFLRFMKPCIFCFLLKTEVNFSIFQELTLISSWKLWKMTFLLFPIQQKSGAFEMKWKKS